MTTLYILGTLLWLLSSYSSIASPVRAGIIWQSTQPQPNSTSQQSSAVPESANQQKTSKQSTASKTTADSPPCSQSSQAGSSLHGSTAKTDCAPKKSSEARSKKHRQSHKADAPAGTEPTKTVVRNGGTDEPTVDLSPGVNQQQASRKIDETNQQLATADANLKKVAGHPMNSSQQDTVKQIKNLMEQSKVAANSGDVQGAYNLAVKANLLSAELSGQ